MNTQSRLAICAGRLLSVLCIYRDIFTLFPSVETEKVLMLFVRYVRWACYGLLTLEKKFLQKLFEGAIAYLYRIATRLGMLI